MTFTATLCVALASAAVAQPGSPGRTPPNIAVVNLTQIFDRYQMTRDLEQMFDERRQSITAAAERKRDDVKLKRQALMDMKPGTPDFAQREEALIEAEVQFQAWLEIQERRLKNQHKSWLEMIYNHAREVIARISQERGIDLVLTYNDILDEAPDSVAFKQQILMRSVIYANARVNLTDIVVETLDSDYQRRGGAATLKTNAPQPAPSP